MTNTNTTVFGKPVSKSNVNPTKGTLAKIFGTSFPTGYEPNGGYFPRASGIKLLKNNLKQLILTSRGERVMLPRYGLNLRRFLFEPLDQVSFNQIKNEIVETVTLYEPKVALVKIQVFKKDEGLESGLGLIDIKLWLRVREESDIVFNLELSIK